MFSLSAAATSLLLLAAPVQEAGPPRTAEGSVPGQAIEDVVVVGQRDLAQAVSGFIAEVAAPARGQGLAVWDRSVCVGTANFRPEHARYLIDRVSEVAAYVGLEPGEPGCRADVLILGTTEATALATRLVDDNLDGFRPGLSATDRGSRALRQFQTVDRPVRWWHVSLPVNRDTGAIGMVLKGEEPPAVALRVASRLTSGLRQDLKRVIIVVDINSLGAASFAQLADYVAMVSLAQLDPDADTSSYASVLNLFAPATPAAGLTQWDVDYLKALYDGPVDRVNPDHQARAIARGMVRARETASDAD